ncbi:hypothetical protein MYFR107205_15725 [Mycolicibacterium frederiksbergense]
MPLVEPSTRVAVRVSPSTSESLLSTFPVRAVSSSVLNESSTVTGVSLTALIVMDTVATELVVVPSSAV